MIIMGQAFEENKDFQYVQDYISKAQTKLKEFQNLSQVLGKFDDANRSNYNKNYFLLHSRNAVSNPFNNGQPDKNSEDKLKVYDVLLKAILPELNGERRSKLISRLKGYGENHFKTIQELEFFLELVKNDAITEITYEDPKKGNHDFSFKFQNEEFNVELTSTGTGMVQAILEDAFNAAANEILTTLEPGTLLKLHADTSMLLDLTGENNPDEIKNILLTNYNKIEKIVKVIKNNFCILGINWSPEKSLYDLKDYYEHYNELGERLSKLLETDDGISYLKNTKIGDIQDNSISSFMYGEAKSRLVEIHSESKSPSKAEDARKISLLRQLKNRIKEKIEEGQLRDKPNPIIAVYFFDLIFHDYTSDDDLFGKQHFQELKSVIEEVFRATANKEILGVILFERNLKSSKFVQNPNIIINNEILEKIDILTKENVSQCQR